MDISTKIKKIREDNNLSQQAFADEIKVSRQSIIAYEKNRTIPQTDVLISICNRFNLDLNYFIDTPFSNTDLDNNSTLIKHDKEIINKNILLDYKAYKNELKKDKKEFNLKNFTILCPIILLLTFTIFILGISISITWFLALPLVIVLSIVRNILLRKYYIKHFNLKLEKVLKDSFPLTPQYYIYLKLKDDGIYIYHNDEIKFYCPYEKYDHFVIYPCKSNNKPEKILFYSLDIYTNEHYNPYRVLFSTFYINDKEEKAVKELYINTLLDFLKQAAFELNKIKK